MRLLLATALLALAAGSAAAQTETPAPLGSAPAGVTAPEAVPAPPAAGRRQPRRVDGAGPAVAKPAVAKADGAETLRKAQAATAARDKAWDVRMKRTLGSICHGC
ncbi:hypothetical protein [Methylobacterium frigidaeris]|uniref:Uncharacterized protein n=1 Tax=Methylobacterium frigidaeris TaxID=2038277 RepID=A0AA37M5I1_9HYPH|nr:hypothetical protein [Methylobacterium frigidaeris]PIK69138.1 hypothetical protein CS379_31345 [Methylobacterium frigidaeris]GJD62756.1 hypothetical protein MPEAHAMD_2914 [Methylobacterium frigidaeris]